MANSPLDVIARYGNWYQGSDDLFAHGLILRSGQGLLLFQGLQVVTVKSFKVPAPKLKQLRDKLRQPIPAAWPRASYAGYNFITDAEGPSATEIAVFGVQSSDPSPPGQYYAAPPDSDVGLLVKAIAKID